MKKLAILAVMLAFGATASPAFGQATRTWVSGVGDDVNPCSRTAPCKTWAGAISKTFIGGEIDALDDGGFGTVTITKSITLDGGGHLASILSSGTNGVNITIAPNPNDPNRRVVLRNLTINGAGASGAVGTNTGLNGISLATGGAQTLALENVRIFGFTQNGIRVAPGVGAPNLNMSLDNVFVADNFGNAFDIRLPNASQQVNALVRDSVFKGTRAAGGAPAGESGIGISADTGAHVWLTGSTVFDNEIGLKTFARQGAAGVIDSFCDNQIGGNIDDGDKPNELCPQPVAPAPQIVTQNLKQCVVPNLKGLPVSFARQLLKAAYCGLGKVTKKKTAKRSQVGKVLSQKTKAGRTLAQGARVAVTVAKR